jgi:hypothetical protein
MSSPQPPCSRKCKICPTLSPVYRPTSELLSSNNGLDANVLRSTMMQMHLQTQPSRELVLHYYNQMIQANVAPSAHTYKLLLDAYGTLEPIDLDAMQRIFDNLCKDQRVDVQGTHWASLIHAYGNVAGQPEKAIEIFESIPTHPATRSKDIEPVCWEAILNVLASAKMTDRMEEYVWRMQQQHVRPTAYINNMLIRGYALPVCLSLSICCRLLTFRYRCRGSQQSPGSTHLFRSVQAVDCGADRHCFP